MDRKPLAPMESVIGKTVRLTPSAWERLEYQARTRGFETLVFARRLIEYALSLAEDQSRMEASVGVRSQSLAGSQRTRRF